MNLHGVSAVGGGIPVTCWSSAECQDWNDLPYIWPSWAPEFWAHDMNANHEPR
ncbi:MAG: hypothetical protein IPI03_01520 [Rubrivivax sp.]|nr:hypothetical protein [Rubrivivax sp.]